MAEAVFVETVHLRIQVIIEIVVTDLGSRSLALRGVLAVRIGAICRPIPIVIETVAADLGRPFAVFLHSETAIGRIGVGCLSGRRVVDEIPAGLPWIPPLALRESVEPLPRLRRSSTI